MAAPVRHRRVKLRRLRIITETITPGKTIKAVLYYGGILAATLEIYP